MLSALTDDRRLLITLGLLYSALVDWTAGWLGFKALSHKHDVVAPQRSHYTDIKTQKTHYVQLWNMLNTYWVGMRQRRAVHRRQLIHVLFRCKRPTLGMRRNYQDVSDASKPAPCWARAMQLNNVANGQTDGGTDSNRRRRLNEQTWRINTLMRLTILQQLLYSRRTPGATGHGECMCVGGLGRFESPSPSTCFQNYPWDSHTTEEKSGIPSPCPRTLSVVGYVFIAVKMHRNLCRFEHRNF